MTAKQIAGYLKARRDQRGSAFGGITFNDGYNVPTFGITQAQYYAIERSMNAEYGMEAGANLTSAGVKKALRNHPISAQGGTRQHATKKSSAKKTPAMSQHQMFYDATRKEAEANRTFLELLPTLRRKELERLIEKRPALWGRYAGYLTSGHVFADDPGAGSSGHATMKKSPAQLQREIDEVLAHAPSRVTKSAAKSTKTLPNKCKITREERALLSEIERGGMHGSVSMRGLNKAAKGLIAKGLGYSIGRIGGGFYIHSTVKGSACLGIDWDNGPRPRYDERKGEYVVSTNGTFEESQE